MRRDRWGAALELWEKQVVDAAVVRSYSWCWRARLMLRPPLYFRLFRLMGEGGNEKEKKREGDIASGMERKTLRADLTESRMKASRSRCEYAPSRGL